MGDGVLVYFGYPNAYEDDRKSITCRPRSSRRYCEPRHFKASSGANRNCNGSGGGRRSDWFGSSQEQAVVGEIPNIAARLQGLAEPDTVVLSGSTRELVRSLFEFADLGLQELKGFAAPQRVWQVLGESTVDNVSKHLVLMKRLR